MTNAEIEALLAEAALLLELEGTEPFRARAYQRAARAAGAWSAPLESLTEDGLRELPGVGKGLAAHIRQACRTGSFPELEALRRRFPAGLRELLRVPGLGPVRARRLFESARVRGLEDLKGALEDGRVRRLPGFGAALARKIAEGLAFASVPARRLRRDVRRLVEPYLARLRAIPGVSNAEVAGSVRRGRETAADADLLAASEDGAAVVAAFVALPGVESVLSRGPEKASVRLSGGLQCDLRVVPASCYGAALQYFTGSKDHNVALRSLARRRGLTVSEYGVFRVADRRRLRPLAGRTEAEVYAALGLNYIEPELRENRGELEAAARGRLPRLIRASDVRGDFHNHSEHTDGIHSLEQMARGALDRGYEWVALGDHSRSLRVARGLSVAELKRTFAELDRVREAVKGIDLMRSMEVDVLEDGSLDYPDEVLDEIDVVVAAVHSAFGMPSAEMTRRLVRAASNPRTDVLGHISGRLIGKRPAYAFDAEEVLSAAAASGAAIELNGQPERLDADEAAARRAKELGAPLALGSDAHSVPQLAFIEDAVVIARRAWLEPGDVLNCLSLRELRSRFEERARRLEGRAVLDVPLLRDGHEAMAPEAHRGRGRPHRAVPRRPRRGQGPGPAMGLVPRAGARAGAGPLRDRARSRVAARAPAGARSQAGAKAGTPAPRSRRRIPGRQGAGPHDPRLADPRDARKGLRRRGPSRHRDPRLRRD